jgi:hypothetical protein
MRAVRVRLVPTFVGKVQWNPKGLVPLSEGVSNTGVPRGDVYSDTTQPF